MKNVAILHYDSLAQGCSEIGFIYDRIFIESYRNRAKKVQFLILEKSMLSQTIKIESDKHLYLLFIPFNFELMR